MVVFLDNHWWIEAAATWMEEIVYDDVRSLLSEGSGVASGIRNFPKYSGNIYSGHEYGDAIFIIYLTDVC